MAFQAFIPIPGADSVLDELLEKVFETAGAKLEGYIHNQLDKRVANGSNSTKTADFKKSADELRATLGVSGGAELNAHAKEQLKKLGTGVIELIKQQLMEALSLHGVDFLELIPCLPLPCCAPSADAMDRGQDGGEGSMPDDTGFFSGEPPFQVNTETITAAVKEISQLKKAIVANDVIADIQKAIIAGSEDNSSAFNFDNSSAELTTETKKKLDMLAGLIKEKVEGDGNVVLQLEGRSPEALALAEQRAQAAHAYLMTKGVSAKHLGHVGVVDASFTPSLVLTAGQPFDEGEGGDVEFRNPSYSH